MVQLTQQAALAALATRWLPVVTEDPAVKRAGGDLVCSPTGLWLALAAIAAGAEGDTADELRTTLGVAGPDAADDVRATARALAATNALAVATGVWSVAPVLPGFRDSLPEVEFGRLDPADLAEVNSWIDRATDGLISTLPAVPDPATRLLLVNALALKARWATPFDPADTTPRPFTAATGAVREVPTMTRELPLTDAWTVAPPSDSSGGSRGSRGSGDAAGAVTVAELACAGESPALVRFVIGAPGAGPETVLPAAWSTDRRPLDADAVRIHLPRFSLRTTLTVTAHLPTLGITNATSDSANFSALSPESLKIDAVMQEALVKVAEKGIEAAAVTSVSMVLTGIFVDERRFADLHFDRPFGVVVLDNTGTIPLFVAWQATHPTGP